MIRESSSEPELELTHASEGNPLGYSLARLEKISMSLRQYGMLIFLLTLLDILFVVFISLGTRYLYSYLLRGGPVITVFATLNFLLALSFIVLYESLRRRGDSIFEEISDELQWNVGYRQSTTSGTADEMPPLKTRVILRSFARTTDLPLIPGKFGPAIYAGMNIILALFLISSVVARF